MWLPSSNLDELSLRSFSRQSQDVIPHLLQLRSLVHLHMKKMIIDFDEHMVQPLRAPSERLPKLLTSTISALKPLAQRIEGCEAFCILNRPKWLIGNSMCVFADLAVFLCLHTSVAPRRRSSTRMSSDTASRSSPFPNLPCAARVSHLWLHAVETMPALAGETPRMFRLLPVIARSRLLRHVATTTLTVNASAGTLIASFVNLRRVLISFANPAPNVTPFLPPARLPGAAPIDPLYLTVNSCLAALGSGCAQLTFVQMRLPTIETAMSFVPLQQLTRLSTLFIWWGNPDGDDDGLISDAQIDSIRAMPMLEQLMIGSGSAGLLHRPLRQPHNLQWKQLNPRFINVDEERAAAIALLPSQHKLQVINCCALSFVSSLTQLRDLSLGSHIDPRLSFIFMPLSSNLLAALSPLAQLTSLQLQSYRLYSADLRVLFESMPTLKQLTLISVRELGDLQCFLAAPASLQTLAFVDVRLPPSVHPEAVLVSLQSLTEFLILKSFVLQRATVSALTPPSTLIPTLKRFEYTAPDEESSSNRKN